jgi:signal transduction histidine kinase
MNVRAISAAGLLSALIALLLGAWFVSGWRDVRMRQADIERAPRLVAEQRASDLARSLRAELDGLVAREFRRPYFHYQNLMHDPQTSAGLNVSRSPLAGGTDEALVRGYFQLDSAGRATTPTVNDEVPELSEAAHLTQNRAFRDHVTRDLARDLKPATTQLARVRVPTEKPIAERQPAPTAAAAPTEVPPRGTTEKPIVERPPVSTAPVAPAEVRAELPIFDAASQSQQATQRIQLDPRVYAQNVNPSAIYSQQVAGASPTLPHVPQGPAAPSIPQEPVTITVSPLEWRTMPFAGEPALIAVREVQTPDRSLTQGFVVTREAVSAWLATRAGDTIPLFRPDPSTGAPVAPGWGVTVEPSQRSLMQAAADSRDIASGFVMRFASVGVVSVLAAALVLLLVTRAESLARERSQFAAAAAHELRTPLAGLQLYGDMLANGLGDPGKMREYARRMSDDAARLGRVVSNILDFTRLERGNLAVEPRIGPVDEVLSGLSEHARPALERLGATLELDVPYEIHGQFDRDALTRIVSNLLDNAEKYSRQATDRTVRLAVTDCGTHVEVSVSDRGPGIADSSQLFHAFSRGTSHGDGPAGLGLGLALSRSLARAMGGDLTYRAREGGGSTFVVQMRRAP